MSEQQVKEPGTGPATQCRYVVRNAERCAEPTRGGNFCALHAEMRCSVCNAPAVRHIVFWSMEPEHVVVDPRCPWH